MCRTCRDLQGNLLTLDTGFLHLLREPTRETVIQYRVAAQIDDLLLIAVSKSFQQAGDDIPVDGAGEVVALRVQLELG